MSTISRRSTLSSIFSGCRTLSRPASQAFRRAAYARTTAHASAYATTTANASRVLRFPASALLRRDYGTTPKPSRSEEPEPEPEQLSSILKTFLKARSQEPKLTLVQRAKAGMDVSDDSADASRLASVKAVYTAIFSNFVIFLLKAWATYSSGSQAMMSETVHSAGDLLNQTLLAIGIQAAKRRADKMHPYGYNREVYIWALISAAGIFFLGATVSIWQGISAYITPQEVQTIGHAIGILVVSALVEGYSLFVALAAVKKNAKLAGLSIISFIRKGSDNLSIAVLLEDSIAIGGVAVALVCLAGTMLTGDTRWDAVGSVIIGCMLAAVAIFLVNKNRYFLLSPNMPTELTDRILNLLRKDAIVQSVHDVKGEIVGPNMMRFKAEIDFDGEALARRYLQTTRGTELKESLTKAHDSVLTEVLLVRYGAGMMDFLGLEVNRIEAEIRKAVPGVTWIDLEAH
mmetsp:Transcript_4489/g.7597  ORF Transcript_4489/g.7597 Transcript_4489/m.7597 type:complete len:459 (+) Transcript_4489:111-1487(+)